MANLSVRKLDEKTVRALRLQAARHNVSMEEEARQILQRAVNIPKDIGALAKRYFGSECGVDLALPKRNPHDPMAFDQ